MKLFITRDVSPSDVCFLIRDELGRDKYTAVMKRRKRSMRGVVNNIVRINILDENKNLVARLRQLPVAGVNSFTLKTDKTAATLVVLMTNNMVQCRSPSHGRMPTRMKSSPCCGTSGRGTGRASSPP